MMTSQAPSKNDEQLLATPIVSNRSVPKDLTLECAHPFSLDGEHQFAMDSPASALTERSNSSHQRRGITPRFSCPDEEPIVVSRLTLRDRDSHDRQRGGLSRSQSPNAEERKRKDRRRRRPLASFSLLSSIATLVTNNTKYQRDTHERRLIASRASIFVGARDIFSCWVRDFSIEVLRRLSSTGTFGFLPNIYHTMINYHRPLGSTSIQLSPSQQLQIRWNQQKRRRNLSFRRRRERPICVAGLPNQGQTCFLNSVLQSLASLEPFLEYLEGIVECQEESNHLYASSILSREVNTGSSRGYGRLFFPGIDRSNHSTRQPPASSFSKELLDLLNGINHSEGAIIEDDEDDESKTPTRARRRPRRKKLNPKSLLHKIAKNNPQFSSYGMYEQQDAQELFASLMGVVIHDSELDVSSSDRRLESSDAQSKNPLGYGISQKSHNGIVGPQEVESDGDYEPMTSALANSIHDKKEPLRALSQSQVAESAPKHLGDNQVRTELVCIEDTDTDDSEETTILSLSSLLLRIGKEQNKLISESNMHSVNVTTPNKSFDERQDFDNNFPEEKKQEHSDVSRSTTTAHEASPLYSDDRHTYGKQRRHQRLLSPGLCCSGDPSPSGKRLMRSTMSSITPSPLSGWLGSTLRCSKCKHVRPIQNTPFLDIPLVPTSVPIYMSRAYQNSTTKPTSPNASPLPSCSLETCLGNFTSVESVDDVECKSCTIAEEIDRLEEEATMLRGAIETTERRIHNKTKSSKTNSKGKDSISLEETRCLREDLFKVETRLLELKTMDPDTDNGTGLSTEVDEAEEDFFFGTTDPRDKIPMQRCEAKKCLLLTRTPSVFCCHIQRRYYDPNTGRMEKCIQFVEFPEFLDLSPYCAYGPRALTPWVAGSNTNTSSQTNLPQPSSHWSTSSFRSTNGNESMPYQLQSVIEHRGNAFGGHYVSYRRDHTGSWFCISDSLVNPVSWREVQTCQAYMLFYEAM